MRCHEISQNAKQCLSCAVFVVDAHVIVRGRKEQNDQTVGVLQLTIVFLKGLRPLHGRRQFARTRSLHLALSVMLRPLSEALSLNI
jgi:hypothetical protein